MSIVIDRFKKEFTSYVFSFYGEGGVYDMAATISEIKRATEIRKLFHEPDFIGDTHDREKVRDVILAMRD